MNNFKPSTWNLIFKIYDEYFEIKTTLLSCETTTQLSVARNFYRNVREKWFRLFYYELDKYLWYFDKSRVSNRIQNQLKEIDADFDKVFDKHLEHCKYVYE